MVRLGKRKFGLFRCPCDKNSTWASAHVYCVYGTFRNRFCFRPYGLQITRSVISVYFRQKCKRCHTPHNPFLVRNLCCPDCGLDRDMCECECIYCNRHRYECTCEFDDDEETGTDKPHRSDLCLKCISGFPCIESGERMVRSRNGRRRRNRRRNRRINRDRSDEIVIYQRQREN